MSIFKEIPPTAGFVLRLRDFLAAFNSPGCLEDDFKRYLDAENIFVTCSGTAGLYLIAETLKSLSAKKTVILPAYVCPSVPLAIARSGLKVQLCDINQEDLSFNLSELEAVCRDNPDILAIIAVHLGGIPVDLDKISRIARQYGAYLIEDCALSMGAEYHGRKIGSFGDFSFFSLARGKGITMYEGGAVIVLRKEHARLFQEKMEQLAKKDIYAEALRIVELIGYWIFYRMQLFWFVSALPEFFWKCRGKTLKALTEDFSIDFPVHRVSKFRKAVCHAQFARLEDAIKEQRRKADLYMKALENIPDIVVVRGPERCRATYPYLILIFADAKRHKAAWESLANRGCGVSALYTRVASDYPYLKNIVTPVGCPNAYFVANHQMTLSTNIFIKASDIDTIISRI